MKDAMDRTDEYFGRTESATERLAKSTTAVVDNPEVGSIHGTARHNDARLTLAEIEKLTGFSYVTLIRYAQQYRDRLQPHCEGEGTKRRYRHTAVAEFETIWQEKQTNRGGPAVVGGKKPARPNPTRRGGSRKPRKLRRATAEKAEPEPSSTEPEPSPSLSKIPTGATTAPTIDLDRMAKLYQLQIQHKALDGVLKFVTEWWTRINAEIEELER